MADYFFGMNLGDPEVESSVQVNTVSNATDLEVRITQTAGHVPTRQETSRIMNVVRQFIESGLNTSWPVF